MPDQILQEIKDKLDLVEVISSYMPLKKSGLNFKAACPFHSEKTASFMVSPQKQIWHCFGCGEGGSVFNFVMRYENIEFRDALKMLAERAGVELPQYRPRDPAEQDEREQFLRINKFAAAFYHKTLLSGKTAEAARVYLKQRGLTEATIKQWQIGFAPDDFHQLEQALTQKKVLPAHAIAAGVLAKNERGQIYDRFRNRIAFPIFNYFGDVVGFSARIMPKAADVSGAPTAPTAPEQGASTAAEFVGAKYINSPETAIYSKSKILFGLNFAKEAIRRANAAVIVEGQMDAISAHQADFKNTVASSGTALTEDHLNLIGRLTKNLIFCFDADVAGQQATRRAGELALLKGFSVKIVVLSGGKDPDELIRANKTHWEQAVQEAIWFIDYYLNQAEKQFAFNSVEQKKYITDMVVPLLAHIQDPIELDHYIKKIADRFNIGDSALRGLIKPFKHGAFAAAGGAAYLHPAAPGGPIYPRSIAAAAPAALEKQVLGGMLIYPDFSLLVKQHAAPEDFSDPEIRALVEVLFNTPVASSMPAAPQEPGGGAETSNVSATAETPAASAEAPPAAEAARKTPAPPAGLPDIVEPLAEALASTLAKEAQFMIESELELLDGNHHALMRELQKAFYFLKVAAIKRRQQSISAEIKQAEKNQSKTKVDELQQQFAVLADERMDYERKL